MLIRKRARSGMLYELSQAPSFFRISAARLFVPIRSAATRAVSCADSTGNPGTATSWLLNSTCGGRNGEMIKSLTLTLNLTIAVISAGVEIAEGACCGAAAVAGCGAGAVVGVVAMLIYLLLKSSGIRGLFLDDRVVTIAREFALHRFGVLEFGKRSYLHVVKGIRARRRSHKHGIVLPSQSCDQHLRVFLLGHGGNLHGDVAI